ncbi:polygalacturonase inhibitor-like [Beta vulgaris subsp. vulgaris]|uniref:polygalacturonase inhibitor-like n=1 Tax=Beta vulgaris subsp. vulgaris TaxID=3555 RepID=UPI002548F8C0|nr:polygalacturonase inhibitor-like [Beta vulgaris subsp. vulgaris]
MGWVNLKKSGQTGSVAKNVLEMTHNNHLIVSLLLFLPLFAHISHSQPLPDICHPHDKNVLLRIKKDLGNPASLSSWHPNTDCVKWEGIRCNNQGHVIMVRIKKAQDIHGIPAFLDQLPFLNQLYFYELPNFCTSIPPYIGKLNNLIKLTISRTNVTGPIPEFLGQLTKLEQLYLSSNKFTGSIPNFIRRLKNLIYLDLSDNLLTGPVPVALAELTNLQSLKLDSNKLCGQIPDFIGQKLKNLQVLQVGFNSLSGTIPTSLGLLPELYSIMLTRNQLSGSIPKWLGRGHLYFVYLGQNKLTGNASFLFEKANTNILILEVEENRLKFDFSHVDLARNLVTMNISHNRIYGSLPMRFGLLRPDNIDVSYNQLCGPIPNGRRFKRVDPIIFSHNKCLCGGPFPGCK